MTPEAPTLLLTLLAATTYALEAQRVAPAPGLSLAELWQLRDHLARHAQQLPLTPKQVAQLHAALLITHTLVKADLIKANPEIMPLLTPEQLERANTFLRDGLPPEFQTLHPPQLVVQAGPPA